MLALIFAFCTSIHSSTNIDPQNDKDHLFKPHTDRYKFLIYRHRHRAIALVTKTIHDGAKEVESKPNKFVFFWMFRKNFARIHANCGIVRDV